MSYTRANLVSEAGRKLFLVSAGHDLSADDGAEIDAKVDYLIDQLREDEVVDVEDLTDIRASYFIPLAELLANICATDFGQQYSEDKKMIFERQLRRTAASRPTYEPLKADYF